MNMTPNKPNAASRNVLVEVCDALVIDAYKVLAFPIPAPKTGYCENMLKLINGDSCLEADDALSVTNF